MWFIEWYKRNSTYIHAFLITAGVLGVLGGVSCLLFPPFLSFLATISLFSFFSLLPPPVSALIMSIMTAGISFGSMAIGAGLMRQILLVAKHVSALFATTEEPEKPLPENNSHALMQPYLQRAVSRYRKDAELEDEQAEVEEENAPKAPPTVSIINTATKPAVAEKIEVDASMASFSPS